MLTATVDFEAHNAEVRRVWDAYGSGRPIRVPMILGINCRFTMFNHEANPRRIQFDDYVRDPEVMLTRQLEHQNWVRRHVRQDAEMGPPDKGWSVSVDFQNAHGAGWFGCELQTLKGEVVDTLPLLRDDARKWEIIEAGVPDPFSHGLMARNWEFFDFFSQKQAEGFEWEGLPLASVTPTGLGSDGPLTVACNLRGAAEFLCDLAADPDYARALLSLVTEATVCRITAYRQKLGRPARTDGFSLADDAI